MQISGDMFRTRRPVTRPPAQLAGIGGRRGALRQWIDQTVGGVWNSMFPGGMIQPSRGRANEAATGVPHRAPNSLREYFGGAEAAIPMASGPPVRQQLPQPMAQPQSPLAVKQQLPLYPQSAVADGQQMQALTGMINRIREGRQGLQDAAARQQELRQSMFDQTWGDYAQQAPFMNRGQSPTFGQAAEGLLPGGISPMTANESEYWRRRNSTSGQAPGTSQMQERFTGFNPLSMGAASNEAMLNAEAAGRGVVLQPGGYGSPLSFAPRAMSDQQVQGRLAGLNNAGNVIDRNYRGPFSRQQADGSFAYTDKLTAAKDAAAAAGGNDAVLNQQVMDLEERNAQRMEAQEARRQAWRERHGGMDSREYRRKNMEQDVERRALRRDMLQGLNPMSPQARALYPEMAQRLQPGAQASNVPNPITAVTDTFTPGGRVTADSKQRATGFLKTLYSGTTDASGQQVPPSPYFAQMGLTGDEPNLLGLHRGIQANLDSGVDPSDEDLQQLYAAAKASEVAFKQPGRDVFSAEDGSLEDRESLRLEVAPIFKKLIGMKEPTIGNLRQWYDESYRRNPPQRVRIPSVPSDENYVPIGWGF